MSNPSFASLNANLLARKGEAKPSGEPRFGSMPWQPPSRPSGKVALPAGLLADGAPAQPPGSAALSAPLPAPPSIGADPAQVRVRLADVNVWPARKPARAAAEDGAGWVAAKPSPPPPLNNPTAVYKTTIRLTHAQARAVKLAALVLDRPQQDILTAGLLDRLEALACRDLAKCSCFQAVLEGLKPPVGQSAQPAV